MGDASGAYDRTTFVVGPDGQVTVGPYTCLNGTYLVCGDSITIGAHCLISWGTTITDSWLGPGATLAGRRLALRAAAADLERLLPPVVPPVPVVVEDAVWVGFDSVVLPGVILGRGCVVGCKTIVDQDVPPNAVVVGNPMRIVRYLDDTDDDAPRSAVMRDLGAG
ncbi:MAG: acyltransferase [Chloroflexota bacterium]|nr:acyltransferase [Chloroflexota bacterium]